MGIESTNLMNICAVPQKYTAQTQTAQASHVTDSTTSANLAKAPETDTFQKTETEAKPALSNKQKGLIAGLSALVIAAGVFIATKGKNKKGLEEGVETLTKKAGSEIIDETAKKVAVEVSQNAEKVAQEAEAVVAKETTAEVTEKVAKEAEAVVAKETTAEVTEKVAKEAEEVIAKEAPEKAAVEVSQSAGEIVKEVKLSGNLEERFAEMEKKGYSSFTSLKPEVKDSLSKLKPENISVLSDTFFDYMCVGINIKPQKIAQLETEFTTKELQALTKHSNGVSLLTNWLSETVNSPNDLQVLQEYLHKRASEIVKGNL